MSAYVISEVEVLDETQGQRYRELAAASIACTAADTSFGKAQPEVPERDWPASQRVVVVEFPTMDRLRGWYASAEYAEALVVREKALLFVDGIADALVGVAVDLPDARHPPAHDRPRRMARASSCRALASGCSVRRAVVLWMVVPPGGEVLA